jgi:hypothetical protein
MTEPKPVEPTTESEPELDPTADTVRRQWADELWYPGGVPYRGRP